MSKPRVLIFVDWFLPGYKGGGPIKSVEAIIANLSDKLDFDVITRDRDLYSPIPYAETKTNQWIEFSKGVRICYLSPGLHAGKIISLAKGQHYSSIYVNSFFSVQFSIKIRILYCLGLIRANKFIVAPRGEMDASRRAIKPAKKKLYLGLAKFLSIYKNIQWHSTSDLETAATRKIFGDSIRITEIPNFSKVSDIRLNASEKSIGQLKIIFLSRIVPYKNLNYIFEILSKLDIVNNNILLDIYGPKEDTAYWQQCEMKIGVLNSRGINITYRGEVMPDMVKEVFSQYHLFFFPTLGENFGHVIAESLLAGTPVLLSDLTPWSDVELHGAGWTYNLQNENGFISTIQEVVEYDQNAFDAKVQKVIQYSKETINHPGVVQKYFDLLS